MHLKLISVPRSKAVYARTGKGVLAIKNRTEKLPAALKSVFLCIDGKASVDSLQSQLEIESDALEQALGALESKGYIKVFSQGAGESERGEAKPAEAEDLDFTALTAEAGAVGGTEEPKPAAQPQIDKA